MSANTVGSYGHHFINDFSEHPAEVGDTSRPRKHASPAVSQSAIVLSQDLKSSTMGLCSGMMPNDWFLEKPGVTPYTDLGLLEAKAMLVLEKLFSSSLNLVLVAGEHLIQHSAAIPYGHKQMSEIKGKWLVFQIDDMDGAEGNAKKAAHIGMLMQWVAVAVNAISCAAGKRWSADEPLLAAIAMCAHALAEVLLEEEYGCMEKSVEEMAGLLKQMGFDEQSANLIAGILAAVVAMSATMALTEPNEDSCAPAAAVAIAGNMNLALQLAALDSGATSEADHLADDCNYLADNLRNKKELSAGAELPVTTAATQPIEGLLGNLAVFMNDDSKGPNPVREEMIRCLQDIMTSTRRIINQVLPHY